MGVLDFLSKHASDHKEVEGAGHKAQLSHELLAGAAAYEAAKAYEKHRADHGKPDSHAKAKELVAAFSGAFIDRIVETKGLNFIDREKVKHDAKKRIEEGLIGGGEY